jgi:hypothetical protein
MFCGAAAAAAHAEQGRLRLPFLLPMPIVATASGIIPR